MIAKNIKGKSFGGCVRYVMNAGHDLLAAEGVYARDSESIIRSFAMQRAGRPEILQPVGHIPLSFSAEDSPRLTNDFLVQLAGEYMKEMGIANTQYVIVRHHNTAHDHIHIIYNRIDNDLKLISVNHDYQRNVKTCKKLKDRHGLTYGEGKEKVNREKLHEPDAVKYAIYDAIKDMLTYCTGYSDLEDLLDDFDITVKYKLRRGTDQVEGVSFCKDGMVFKGSEIDRKFSHANLQKAFEKNRQTHAAVNAPADFDLSKYIPDMPEAVAQKPEPALAKTLTKSAAKAPATLDFDISKYVDDPKPAVRSEVRQPLATEKPAPTPHPEGSAPGVQGQQSITQNPVPVPDKPVAPARNPMPVHRNPRLMGVEFSDEQVAKLKSGEYIRLEGMRCEDGRTFSAYVFSDDELKGAFTSELRPDQFVKYGKYEMRAMDRALIEKGFVVRATVKWHNGRTARPYLWKENPTDTGYKESWDDPRKSKQTQTETLQRSQPTSRSITQQPQDQPAPQSVPQQPKPTQKTTQTEARKPWRPPPPKKKSGIKR